MCTDDTALGQWRAILPNYWPREPETLSCGPVAEIRLAGLSTDDGETGTRTRDTTIFSRVLYQLSYLAVAGRC